MNITEYQEQTGCTLTWLARRVGCAVPTLAAIKHGRTKPGLDLAFALERETKGAIRASDFVAVKEPVT